MFPEPYNMSLILDDQPMMELEDRDGPKDEKIILVENQVSSMAEGMPIM